MKKIIIAIGVTLILSIYLNAQPDAGASNPNEAILRYSEFLREEARLHREYTQAYYSNLLGLITAIGIIAGAVLTWLNWNSKANIRNQVNEQFKSTVGSILDEKVNQIDHLIQEGKEKTERQFEEINRLILELSTRSYGLVSEPTESKEQRGDIDYLEGKRILWVDDYPENNRHPQSILKAAGVRIDLALETEEAYLTLDRNRFDLIISDMGRGENRTAGLDLLKGLKERNNKTPAIIFASRNAINNYGEEAQMLGAKATAASITELLMTVHALLRKSKES